MNMETDENDELLGMFVQEAVEHIETIEPDLLTLEEQGADTDTEVINRLFRSVHSIKGSAGFFGLTAISKLSHIMENLLGKVRERAIVASPAVSDSLLSGLDKLQTMINDVSNSEKVDATEQINAIQSILDHHESGASGPPPTPVAAPAEAAPAPEPVHEDAPAAEEASTDPAGHVAARFDLASYAEDVGHAIQHGQKFFTLQLETEGTAKDKKTAFDNLQSLLASVGKVVDTSPKVSSGDFSAVGHYLDIFIATVLEKDLLQSLIQIPMEKITNTPIPDHLAKSAKSQKASAPAAEPHHDEHPAAPPPPPPPMANPMDLDMDMGMADMGSNRGKPALRKPQQGNAKGKGSESAKAQSASGGVPSVEETLRVSVSLLDELINNAGELVLARNQLVRASADVATQFPNFTSLVQNLDSITSRIQERVMQARMQPVSVVFNKFPRIIRDLARKLNKKIDLEIRGGEVDLDKSVIEHLSDPLTHMIRNVADHGIEEPDARVAVGKPDAGQVELAAYHENGMVNISLSDDGAGIDAVRIKAKAMEKGLITERQADTMPEEEALGLIFAPGFSMAKKISDVSGRGVGMDVVRTNIEKLGGTVHIESKVGKGTRIILKLPLTLAIIPAMIVSAGKQRFAIPEIGLVEIVRVAESDRANQIEVVGNAPVLRLRNMLLPLVDLADVLGIQRVWPPESESPERRQNLHERRSVRTDGKSEPAAETKKSAARRDSSDRRAPGGLVAYIMVLNVGGNEFGMVVDEVLDSEEIVVKPLPSFFKDNPCFSATTILGDGTVSLIIDYAGVMEQANINFSNVERASRMDLDDERRAALREKQNIILLETETGLLMGIVHSMVRRVEKIPPNLLDNIGGLPYVRYDGKTFRAVYPDQVLGLEGMSMSMGYASDSVGGEEDDNLCMVVPNIPDMQAGLIFKRIIDTRETAIDLDCRAIRAEGLFGSAQIDDRVVLFPDVNLVFDIAGISSPHPPPQVNGTGLRALVVDDTPFLRALTASYLTGAGFYVDQAEDGTSALKRLKEEVFDLLVTDLNMPLMDGFELAIEVAGTPMSEIPIIATTSSISSDLEQRCARAGFVSCVPTIDKNRLLSVVATLQTEELY
ncbi:CheA signal transduction histidine kinases [Magnetococcus marinus MC-1]|uniref:Chemotaxis protein CheA n=1 Tax=Magnetococcus marinus (strain ATCC BAA-1437 / JCM 17883 / MC-1) TaxID=156889 RepID=A0LDL8_MAGMM|nr:chemotaxis protein CheW [Magnetococcus marinus]ABK46061.1 CheA signal transduction histidine kinases [Magnetococcus marinus MC-1]